MVENILAQINGDMSDLKRDEMGFESCKDDSDVLFCSANKNGGTDYYQDVLIYTDNILEIIENLENFIRHELGKRFVVKTSSIGPSNQYPRKKVSYVTLDNGWNA